VRSRRVVDDRVMFTSIGIDRDPDGESSRTVRTDAAHGGPDDAVDSWQGTFRMGQVSDEQTFRRAVEYRTHDARGTGSGVDVVRDSPTEVR